MLFGGKTSCKDTDSLQGGFRVVFLQVNKLTVMFIWNTNCLGIAIEFLRKKK